MTSEFLSTSLSISFEFISCCSGFCFDDVGTISDDLFFLISISKPCRHFLESGRVPSKNLIFVGEIVFPEKKNSEGKTCARIFLFSFANIHCR